VVDKVKRVEVMAIGDAVELVEMVTFVPLEVTILRVCVRGPLPVSRNWVIADSHTVKAVVPPIRPYQDPMKQSFPCEPI
jgi:hypothetical protein